MIASDSSDSDACNGKEQCQTKQMGVVG